MNTLTHHGTDAATSYQEVRKADNKSAKSHSDALSAIERMTVYAGGGAFLGVSIADILDMTSSGTVMSTVISGFVGLIVLGLVSRKSKRNP